MLNSQIRKDVEESNFAFSLFLQNTDISGEQLNKLINHKHFEHELEYCIGQYNLNNESINDELRNNIKQLETQCEQKRNERQAIIGIPVDKYYKNQLCLLNKDYCRQNLDLIEKYDNKVKQITGKYSFFNHDQVEQFQAQLQEKKEVMQSKLEKLESEN